MYSLFFFVSGSYLLYLWLDFKMLWYKCLPGQDNVSCGRVRCVSQRSRSQLKVKCSENPMYSLFFFVSGSYLLYLWLDFQMLWYKCPPGQDDVSCERVRCVSQRSRSQLKVKCSKIPCIHCFSSCPDHIFSICGWILKCFGTNVHQDKTMCHAKELGAFIKGQGHSSMSSGRNSHVFTVFLRVRIISSPSVFGFSNALVQMSTRTRRCVMRKS